MAFLIDERTSAALDEAGYFSGYLYNDGNGDLGIKKNLKLSLGVQPASYQPVLKHTIHPEEEQPQLCRPTMHQDEDPRAAQVYDVNLGSVVGISSGNNSCSMGSGFVWDDKGHIVTNCHVIQNATDIRVTFHDCTTYGAKVVGFCEGKDVAVLRAVELEGKVKPISIGICANLRVGDPIFAIGSPFGLDYSLTTGVISFLGRIIASPVNGRPIQDVIQISAAINCGNSGGPLFDRFASLIGINTANYSSSGAFCGVGYSIPIDSVRGIIDQLVRNGKVLHPHLGITVSSQFLDESDWLLVVDVAVDGPAAKAGIQKTDPHTGILGDFITSVNGKKVTNSDELLLILDLCKEGEKVTLEVLRGGQKENISVTLELNPDESELEVMCSTRTRF